MSDKSRFLHRNVAGSETACADPAAPRGAVKRCVLAYSGGLDTTTIVIWLRERGYEVHAVLVDVGQFDAGQGEDLHALCQKALKLGAKSAVVRDARPAMCAQVLPWVIRLGATYEGVYRLGTALARPFIAAEQVRLARSLGGATLVHGATGKGNDQIRFEFAYRSLAPEYPVLAPWKVWELRSRSDMVAYLRQHGVDESFEVSKTFSLDENLWHLSIEGGPLEDPLARVDVPAILAAMPNRFDDVSSPSSSPSPVRLSPGCTSVELAFADGVPVSCNGQPGDLASIVEALNRDFRDAPWAWDLVIENRFTGIKSRGLYINPAAKLLGWAVDALARSCLNKVAYDAFMDLGRSYGELLYRGEYYSDQRVMIEAAAGAVSPRLSGTARLELTPTPYVSRIDAPASIFTLDGATFEDSDFSHQDAAGFIRLAWLSSAGRSFEGTEHGEHGEHGSDVATANGTAPDVPAFQSMSGRGLVPVAS